MKELYEITELPVSFSRKAVLEAIDCREDSPVYEEMAEAYEELAESIKDGRIVPKPVGMAGFSTLPQEIETSKYPAGTPVLYVVAGIGPMLSEESSRAFAEGDYVRGMLCDAMADQILFSMGDRVKKFAEKLCRDKGWGILKRLEAPGQISMRSQRVMWEELELRERFGISISSGYMFDPVKTSGQVFVLTKDTTQMHSEHDCRHCMQFDCKGRNVPPTYITFTDGSTEKKYLHKDGETLLEMMQREHIFIDAVCAGRGSCGKCRVQVLEGECEIGSEDERFFSESELEEGWRLACRLYPMDELTIALPSSYNRFFVQGSEESIQGADLKKPESRSEADIKADAEDSDAADSGSFASKPAQEASASAEPAAMGQYDAAIDIGTTTLAFALYRASDGERLHTVVSMNGQKTYGADVISRIQASVDQKGPAMKEQIQKDLRAGLQQLLAYAGGQPSSLRRVAIACNTTMGHLLLGYSCKTLGVYPFDAVDLNWTRMETSRMLGWQEAGGEAVLFPGISTFVGGDIVSGLYVCGFSDKEEVCMLIDLGTNGEMAIGNRNRILSTSTAAGPAFEGGNILWGTGSVAGAIRDVRIRDGKAGIRTIFDQAPVGICGTGVVSTVCELVKEGLADDTGLLEDDYFEDGFELAKNPQGKPIVFTQKDIREIQLAKAAVRAGIETLLKRFGTEADKVDCIYVAGGFGCQMDFEQAMLIGMFPKAFEGRIETVGNSSLSGAASYLKDPKAEEKIAAILSVSEEIALSADPDFQEAYMDAMYFTEE